MYCSIVYALFWSFLFFLSLSFSLCLLCVIIIRYIGSLIDCAKEHNENLEIVFARNCFAFTFVFFFFFIIRNVHYWINLMKLSLCYLTVFNMSTCCPNIWKIITNRQERICILSEIKLLNQRLRWENKKKDHTHNKKEFSKKQKILL